MDEKQALSSKIILVVTELTPSIHEATAATTMAGARLLGVLGAYSADEAFETALKNTMLLYEKCARSERKAWQEVYNARDNVD